VLTVDEPIYRRDEDIVAELVDLLNQAVADRLRTDRIGIFFSGGIDSSAILAFATPEFASVPSAWPTKRNGPAPVAVSVSMKTAELPPGIDTGATGSP
jgi:asparagine synthetase B (glutamine-hydrolysing)